MMRKIKNSWHLLQAIVASILYGFPAKKLIVCAVTGTDGKTTTATLLYHMMQEASMHAALISTVGASIDGKQIDTGFHVTTPSPFVLQRLLARVVASGATHVVIETTSHAIDQNRVWGIHPTVAAITNVTHEHLDYHPSFLEYLRTKVKIFTHSEHAVINKDATESYSEIIKLCPQEKDHRHIVTVESLTPGMKKAVKDRFKTARYNYENAAIATKMAQVLGLEERICMRAISNFVGVPGRMQEIFIPKGPKVIIDFAHTPNALESLLTSLTAERKKGKIILVFGCAGQRDRTKRPAMGKIASEHASYVVLTSEDPRSEDPWSIIAQIKSGVVHNHNAITSIADRAEAIRFALEKLATPNDCVVITGKGHEKSMCIGKVEYPWSDEEQVKKISTART